MSTDVRRAGFLEFGVWDVQKHWDALDAAFPRFDAAGARICYVLDGTPVLMSPASGAIPLCGWWFPLGHGPKRKRARSPSTA